MTPANRALAYASQIITLLVGTTALQVCVCVAGLPVSVHTCAARVTPTWSRRWRHINAVSPAPLRHTLHTKLQSFTNDSGVLSASARTGSTHANAVNNRFKPCILHHRLSRMWCSHIASERHGPPASRHCTPTETHKFVFWDDASQANNFAFLVNHHTKCPLFLSFTATVSL